MRPPHYNSISSFRESLLHEIREKDIVISLIYQSTDYFLGLLLLPYNRSSKVRLIRILSSNYQNSQKTTGHTADKHLYLEEYASLQSFNHGRAEP